MIQAVVGWPLTLAGAIVLVLGFAALIFGILIQLRAAKRCPDCDCRVDIETAICLRCGCQLLPV